MKIKTQFQVGKVTYFLEAEGKNDMDTLHQSIILSNPPRYCHACANDNADHFRLASNKDGEGNIYVNMTCTNCGANAKLGQYKSGGFFWHKFEKYVKKEQ